MKVFIPALLASVLVLGAPRGAAAQDFRVTLDDVQFHNPAIRIGQGLELKENETVRGALVIGGDATIAGRVDEDVVVILGKVNLASTAVIEGSLVVIGGTAVTADGARVHRDLFVVGGHEGGASFAPGGSHVVIGTAGMGAWFAGIVPWLTHGLLLGRPIVPSLPWVWGIAGTFFLVNLLFNVLFDNPIRAVTTTLRATPLTTFMTGLLVMLLFGPVCFLLAVSLIGIAVIPVLLCALLVAAVLGKIAFARWIGLSVVRPEDDTTRAASMITFLVGSAVMCVAYMIPVLGLVTWAMAGVFGLGAATLAFFSAYRRENPRKPKITKDTKDPIVVPAPQTASAAQFSSLESSGLQAGSSLPPEGRALPPEGGAFPPEGGALPPGGALPLGGALPPEGGSYLPRFAAAGVIGTGLLVYPRARFIERLAAFTLDFILVVIVVQALNLDRNMDFPLGRVGMLLAIAYHVGFWAWRATTLGGIICQLRVTRTDGAPLQFVDALVRGLTGIFSLAVLGLGFLWVLRDPEQQAWHDRVAGTYVVKVPRDCPI